MLRVLPPAPPLLAFRSRLIFPTVRLITFLTNAAGGSRALVAFCALATLDNTAGDARTRQFRRLDAFADLLAAVHFFSSGFGSTYY